MSYSVPDVNKISGLELVDWSSSYVIMKKNTTHHKKVYTLMILPVLGKEKYPIISSTLELKMWLDIGTKRPKNYDASPNMSESSQGPAN